MFQGNGVFMQNGQAVIPPGSVADRLAQGNFGPTPNNTAPPGFQIPRTLSPEELAKGLAGPVQGQAPQPQMQGVPEGFSFDAASGTFQPPSPIGSGNFGAYQKFISTPEGQRWMAMQQQGPLGFGLGGGGGMGASGVGMGAGMGGVAGGAGGLR